MKFKVGDRVATKLGETGTVIDVKRLSGNVAVEMDGPDSGIFTRAFPGKHVLWLPEEAWKKINQKSKILITSDGHTTTARLYDGKKVTKTAEAKCNPEDKFDFGTGAKLAFDRLMGEKKAPAAQDKPAEPAKEPIKLYCVKSYKPGEWVTKGKTYEIAGDGEPITFDDGWSEAFALRGVSFDSGTIIPNYLVPLVSRPAKVGEWIYITKSHESRAVNGKIYEVAPSGDSWYLYIKHPDGLRHGDHAANVFGSEYLVLDGYDGRYEEPENPTYYNGKVVCVDDDGSRFVTTGKVYSFVDGWSKDNMGGKLFSAPMESLDEINRRAGAKFIEFKGEADAK